MTVQCLRKRKRVIDRTYRFGLWQIHLKKIQRSRLSSGVGNRGQKSHVQGRWESDQAGDWEGGSPTSAQRECVCYLWLGHCHILFVLRLALRVVFFIVLIFHSHRKAFLMMLSIYEILCIQEDAKVRGFPRSRPGAGFFPVWVIIHFLSDWVNNLL